MHRPRQRHWRKLRTLSWGDRFLLIEAAFWLGFARIAVLLPFRWLAPKLGEPRTETDGPQVAGDQLGERVSRAVIVASRFAPWKTKCLVEAIAAKAMLRLRGIPTTLYLGCAKEEGEMTAHAWLRSGSQVVTGEVGMERYSVIASFGELDP